MENRVGASGRTGIVSVVQSPPDGYTLAVMNGITHGTNPAVTKDLGYDPVKDLEPVIWMGESALVFLLHKDVPANNMAEFVDLLRKNPGKLNYGTGGVGTAAHLALVLFLSRAGLPQNVATHIPYKGEAPALVDLLAGQVQFSMIAACPPEHVASGALKAIATTGTKRWSRFPDYPTVIETGYDGVVYNGWQGIGAPRGTPAAVIDRINTVGNEALRSPSATKALLDNGFSARGGSAGDLGRQIESDVARWKKVVADNALKFD